MASVNIQLWRATLKQCVGLDTSLEETSICVVDQAGEVDRTGRISNCGDRMARTHLYEAAGVLPAKVSPWLPLKACGTLKA